MYDAQGSKLFMGDVGSPEAFQQVLKIRRLSDPSFTRPWKDRTNLDSTAREGKPGMVDIGEFSIEVFWHPDDAGQHEALIVAHNPTGQQATKKRFRIQWPDNVSSYVDFDGYVLGFTGVEEVDGDLVRTFSFRGTGAPVFGE